MFSQIARIATRSPSQMVEDIVGVAALFLVVFIGLTIPGLI